MIWSSHIAVGLGLTSLTGELIESKGMDTTINLMIVVLFSLLPDIDHPKSKISTFLFPLLPVSYLIYKKYGHRTITHSLWFWLFLSLVLIIFMPTNEMALIASIAYLSHILSDLISMGGVPLFYPQKKKRYAFIRLEINGIGEQFTKYVMLSVFIVFTYEYLYQLIQGILNV